MRALFIFLLGSSALAVQPVPAPVEPTHPVELDERRDEDGTKDGESRRFRIDADIQLPDAELRRLANIADTTQCAINAFPLPLHAPPPGELMRLVVCGTDQAYSEAGGVANTAGVYLPRRQCVVLHAGHLFQAKPGSSLKAAANEDLMVHEIGHQVMHGVSGRLPQWLNEGLCEYFACAHFGGGRFRFDQMEREIREHLRSRFDPLDPKISLRSVQELLDSSHRSWSDYLSLLPLEVRHHAYATALLLTHYHLHGGPARYEQIKAALEPRSRRDPDPLRPEVFKAAEIQAQLVEYWKPKGLQLVFSKDGPG